MDFQDFLDSSEGADFEEIQPEVTPMGISVKNAHVAIDFSHIDCAMLARACDLAANHESLTGTERAQIDTWTKVFKAAAIAATCQANMLVEHQTRASSMLADYLRHNAE